MLEVRALPPEPCKKENGLSSVFPAQPLQSIANRHEYIGGTVAIAVHVHPRNLSFAKMGGVAQRLAEIETETTSRIHHALMGADGDLMVNDIWESEADFEAFYSILIPLLNEAGVEGV